MNLLDEKDLKALRAELDEKSAADLALYLTEVLNSLIGKLTKQNGEDQRAIIFKSIWVKDEEANGMRERLRNYTIDDGGENPEE